MSSPLEKEFNHYIAHQDEFVKEYEGKVIVLKNCEVIGVFETEPDAIETVSEREEPGTFLVQRCEPGQDNYTMTFHSRVAFV